MKTEVSRYNTIARSLHWVSAIAILAMFVLGVYEGDMEKLARSWHKSIGIIFAVLIVFRLFWKFKSQAPKMIGSTNMVLAARCVHAALYLLLITIFVSGYLFTVQYGPISVFGVVDIPSIINLSKEQTHFIKEIHETSAFTLIGLALLHALAALKHHFVDKDSTLKKML